MEKLYFTSASIGTPFSFSALVMFIVARIIAVDSHRVDHAMWLPGHILEKKWGRELVY